MGSGGWLWSYSLGKHNINVPFFQYSVKLGRSLLISTNVTVPIAQKHWTNWGVSILQLKTYWRWIWSFKGPTKFILFRWLLVYVALSVGQSLKGNVAPNLRQCGFCYATQETTKHALWSCPLAQQVWNKVLSLFLTTNVGCLFSWEQWCGEFYIPAWCCMRQTIFTRPWWYTIEGWYQLVRFSSLESMCDLSMYGDILELWGTCKNTFCPRLNTWGFLLCLRIVRHM